MFVEGFRSPQRLRGILARYAERGKAVVVAKMGTSEAGRSAAVSHTAHTAGQPELYRALFDHYGVYQATDVSDLLDAAAALSCWGEIGGRGVGIITGSGGAAVWTAEACVAAGLAVPELEADRQEAIFADLAYYAAARNPVDVTAGGIDSLIKAIGAVAASPRIDAIGLIAIGPQLTDAGHRATIREVIDAAGKPCFAYAHHPASAEQLDALAELRLPNFVTPHGLATGIKALSRYSEAAARLTAAQGTAAQGTAASTAAAWPGPLVPPPRSGTAPVLCEFEVKAWLRDSEFPVPRAGWPGASTRRSRPPARWASRWRSRSRRPAWRTRPTRAAWPWGCGTRRNSERPTSGSWRRRARATRRAPWSSGWRPAAWR
jgi:acyl-CoA synthetase (NDP forming)